MKMRSTKPCSTLLPYAKINLIHLTPYHWQTGVSNFRDIRKGRLCKIFFQNKECFLFDILQEILQSHPFSMSRKFKTEGCKWYGVKRIKCIVADKMNEQDLRDLFITSSSFHFLTKTDLKQSL